MPPAILYSVRALLHPTPHGKHTSLWCDALLLNWSVGASGWWRLKETRVSGRQLSPHLSKLACKGSQLRRNLRCANSIIMLMARRSPPRLAGTRAGRHCESWARRLLCAAFSSFHLLSPLRSYKRRWDVRWYLLLTPAAEIFVVFRPPEEWILSGSTRKHVWLKSKFKDQDAGSCCAAVFVQHLALDLRRRQNSSFISFDSAFTLITFLWISYRRTLKAQPRERKKNT